MKRLNSDTLATIFGAIAGIAHVLVAANRIPADDGELISGLALVALGIISNKKTDGFHR
ncbi:MAG: hypothetical protein QQW96_03715 [Tychonema bourrellyi B0820]|nr:hypothetical protein [Tychonema bourrellyi B0820]